MLIIQLQPMIKIAFNAGSLTDSIIMKTEDYLELAKPVIFSFSE